MGAAWPRLKSAHGTATERFDASPAHRFARDRSYPAAGLAPAKMSPVVVAFPVGQAVAFRHIHRTPRFCGVFDGVARLTMAGDWRYFPVAVYLSARWQFPEFRHAETSEHDVWTPSR